MTDHDIEYASDEPTTRAFRRVRRLAESEAIPHGSPERPSSPPSFCGWRALEFCQGRHPLSLTWLPPQAS